MVDSIEIRLDQLTQAIKGLYAKSSMSQGEIYNTLTSLSQRYENLTNVSGEKIAATLISEFRKTIDSKYNQTNQLLKDLENGLKAILSAQQNPKTAAEITRLLNDTASIYTKLNHQDLAIQKLFESLEQQKNFFKNSEEIANLTQNFRNFSQGFENITITLNKNFADFLSQLKQNSTKEEITSLISEIYTVSGNVNSVISAIAVIDSKYKDLTGLISTIQQRDNIFNDAIQDIKLLGQTLESVKETIKSTDAKTEIETLGNNIKSQIENIKFDIQKIVNETNPRSDITALGNDFRTQIENIKHEIQKAISETDSRNELETFNSGLKSQIENIKYDIQKMINATDAKDEVEALSCDVKSQIESSNSEFKKELNVLTGNFSNVQNNVNTLTSSISNTKNEIKNLSSTIQGLGEEVKNIHNLVNDEILYKSHQNDESFQRYLNATKEEIKTLLIGLTNFKKDLTAINEGNVKILQEPIERALEDLKNTNIGSSIRDLSENLRDVSIEVQSSVQNIQDSITDIKSASSMQILTQISETIPSITDKLEMLRSHVVEENSAHLGELKTTFGNTISEVKENLLKSIDKFQEDAKTINIETIDTLKVDLQRLSDSITDNVENVSDKIQKEFADYKSELTSISAKQNDSAEKLDSKMAVIEEAIESLSKETIEKVSDTIDANNTRAQDILNEIKGDILGGISDVDKTTKNSITQFELKIDKLLNNFLGADLDNISEKKSLKDTIEDIEQKIEKTNLQQIHNAKELLEEIQTTAQNIDIRIAEIGENKDTTALVSAVTKFSERIQLIEDSYIIFEEKLEKLQDQVEQKLKENVQKIATLIENTPQQSNENQENPELNNLSNKVSEYLSNFEFLKSNISQEIKENIAGEFNKIKTLIGKLSSPDEKTGYSYTLTDVESDIANLRIAVEKGSLSAGDLKNIFEKVVELKTIGLENIKSNRDTETQLGYIQGWFKDTVSKINEMQEVLDNIQNNGFEDIKTRILQSEKSKLNSIEFATRVENALKLIIRNSKAQDEKISTLEKKLDLLTQAQAEGFNPNQFIDIFYENMTQTKMLSNRVEIIEDKINSVQMSVEKLLSYVEQ